jgi:serine/threonine protein kinase
MGDPGGIPDDSEVTLSPGTRLGKYEIVRLLGAGGMGSVYEAAHTEIGKRVAVKVLSPAVAAVPGARARFLREAQLTSRVRHPNIVDVTDMGSDAGQTYLVMEFLRGEDLAQRLARTGPLPSQELVDIMLPVCSAVVEAHDAGVTHRDLKPQNIFLAAARHSIQPKVLDFGISKGNDIVGSGTLTGTGTMIGTPFYLAPEQIIDSRAAGPQSDQYALGVIMYECLTGNRPFEAESIFIVFQAIVLGRPAPLRRSRPDIPAALENVVLRAMHVDPNARFGSTKDLGRALLPFASSRARANWEEVFTAPRGDTVPPVQPPVASFPGGTKELTPAAARLERAWLTPPESAIETLDVSGGRGSRRSRTVTLLGIIAGVAGIAVILAVAVSNKGPSAPVPPGALPAAPTRPTAAASPPPAPPRPQATTASPAAVTEAPRQPPSAPEPKPETFEVKVGVEPDTAGIEFDGEPAGSGSFQRTLPVDHVRHTLRVTAPGYGERTVEFTDRPPSRRIKLPRSPRPAAKESAGAAPIPRPPRRPPTETDPPPPARTLNPNGAPVID